MDEVMCVINTRRFGDFEVLRGKNAIHGVFQPGAHTQIYVKVEAYGGSVNKEVQCSLQKKPSRVFFQRCELRPWIKNSQTFLSYAPSPPLHWNAT